MEHFMICHLIVIFTVFLNILDIYEVTWLPFRKIYGIKYETDIRD